MIISVTATVLIALLAMVPGWLMTRGRATGPGVMSAAMAASLTVIMLITALIGVAVHALFAVSLPVLLMPAVAALACLGAFMMRPGSDEAVASETGTAVEWQGIAIGAAFLAYGFFVQLLAVRTGNDGALIVHGWFNADWFKHLGHVSAIGNYGVPAMDNFGQADLLHYYWLSYVLPAAGQAIGNDSWSALAAANGIYVMLFGSIFYGVIRKAGVSRNVALVIGILALFVSAPISFVFQLFFGIGLDGILNYPAAPKGPALLTLSQYIPQHLLAIIVLLGWFLLKDEAKLKWFALVALASAMTISVLLGAVVLTTYGLYRLGQGRQRAVPELAGMVVLSGLFVLAFQVVQIGNVGSAIESPLLTNVPSGLPLGQRIFASLNLVIGNVGLPFLISVLGLYYWRPSNDAETQSKSFAIALIASALIAAVAVEIVMPERLAIEARIRAVNLPAIANAIIGAKLFQLLWSSGTKKRVMAVSALVIVTLVAVPSAALRTAWHGQIGDNFTTVIPSDDRAVLETIRDRTERTAIVMQFPEPPVLTPERGGDAWAAILGQRAVTGSLRATDYAKALPRIEAAEKFFKGEDVAIAPEVDLAYLSRALHPDTYDALVERMDADPAFFRLDCYADACLFQRRDSSNQ